MLIQFFGPIIPRCTGIPLTGGESMCTLCDLLTLIDNLVKFATMLASFLVVIFIIWGAFLIMTAASSDRVKQGRQVIITAVIGLAIVLGAWIIVSTIFLLITGSYQGPLPMPWYRVSC